MVIFDVSQKWVILAPLTIPAARQGTEELSYYIDALRKKSGLKTEKTPIHDADTDAPEDSVPVILLNPGAESRERNGFTWRAGKNRIEIYGDSDRGLLNGIFDFLGNLGILWPESGKEELPPPVQQSEALIFNAEYLLKNDRAHSPSNTSLPERRRVIINRKLKTNEKIAMIRRAARNKIDAVIFSFGDKAVQKKSGKVWQKAEQYALIIERGGWELSLLVPRRYFFLHRDLFRMEGGKRTAQFNFCPTNPATIDLIKKQGEKLFRPIPGSEDGSKTGVLHLWPDQGHERTWCSCPACRAFTPEEQNRIAVNAASDALREMETKMQISCYEVSTGSGASSDNSGFKSDISLRPNVFALTRLPVNLPAAVSGQQNKP
jgi:hypothetical protein